MRAKAPGKVVLSGAYVVFDGAPAVVVAVDRYAIAYDTKRALHMTAELRAAFPDGDAPYVDSNELRYEGRKMGLGSSAAAIVAALTLAYPSSPDGFHDAILERAFRAHREAQGGGSGIDIVASTCGGVQVCSVEQPGQLPDHREAALPTDLVVEVWLCPASASTPELLGQVRALAHGDPTRYRQLVAPAVEGARELAHGLWEKNVSLVLDGAQKQRNAMVDLGEATGAPVLLSYMNELHVVAQRQGGLFAQAGSGGGDIALYFGRDPSSSALRQRASELGLRLLSLSFGARGTHIVR